MHVPHLPPCAGAGLTKLDQFNLTDHRTGEVKASVSSVNPGIIRKDLQRIAESRAALRALSSAQLIEICARAGDHFLNGTLPLGASHTQSPAQYIETLSATSGLPHVMVRRNMAKIHQALTQMRTVLNGLTRGLDLSILDAGVGEQAAAQLTPRRSAFMPSNSPAVNSLWLPAIAHNPGRDQTWPRGAKALRLIRPSSPPVARPKPSSIPPATKRRRDSQIVRTRLALQRPETPRLRPSTSNPVSWSKF
jgi:hypothetical protein